MIILEPVDLRWVKGRMDDPHDLCAHGDFEFRIGEETLSRGDGGRDLSLSAAALYLLRTLEREHTKERPVGDHLFPCCGFSMYDTEGSEDVLIIGCPSGEDFAVHHQPSGEGVVVRSESGGAWSVPWSDWRAAVFAFVDRVSAFYASGTRKQPSSEAEPGFRKFLAEWKRRRGQPLGAGAPSG